jgi:hypothetical protein
LFFGSFCVSFDNKMERPVVDHSDPNFPATPMPSGPSSWDDRVTHELVIDYAGNWIFKPVSPLKPAPAPHPPAARRQAPPDKARGRQPQSTPKPQLAPVSHPPPPWPPAPSAAAEVPARKPAASQPAPDPCTTAGMTAILRDASAHIGAYHGDVVAALAAAKAYGANPDGYRSEQPPPRVWPYPIAEAEAGRLFQAGCQAAHDAATSAEVPAQGKQQQRTTVHHAVSVVGQAHRRIEVVTSSTQGQQNGLPAGAAAPATRAPDPHSGSGPSGFRTGDRGGIDPHAQAAHDPISVTDEAGGSPLIAGWSSGLASGRPESKPRKPLPELELAASTMNPKYAARMLGYDMNTFGGMIHRFKPEHSLRPNDNLQFYDNGDVFFQGQYVGNIHDFAP